MDKNDFVFGCITGLPIGDRPAGAENDGWRDRNPLKEVADYYWALQGGDLGPELKQEFEECDGEFDAEIVAKMIDFAKSQELKGERP